MTKDIIIRAQVNEFLRQRLGAFPTVVEVPFEFEESGITRSGTRPQTKHELIEEVDELLAGLLTHAYSGD